MLKFCKVLHSECNWCMLRKSEGQVFCLLDKGLMNLGVHLCENLKRNQAHRFLTCQNKSLREGDPPCFRERRGRVAAQLSLPFSTRDRQAVDVTHASQPRVLRTFLNVGCGVLSFFLFFFFNNMDHKSLYWIYYNIASIRFLIFSPGMGDLSCLTRNWTHTPCIGRWS